MPTAASRALPVYAAQTETTAQETAPGRGNAKPDRLLRRRREWAWAAASGCTASAVLFLVLMALAAAAFPGCSPASAANGLQAAVKDGPCRSPDDISPVIGP